MLLLGADLVFFSLANPNSGQTVVVVIASALLALTFYCLYRTVALVLGEAIGFGERAQKRLAKFAAVFSIFLILLQSVGQLSAKEALGASILAIVLYIYISYISTARNGVRAKDTRAQHN